MEGDICTKLNTAIKQRIKHDDSQLQWC